MKKNIWKKGVVIAACLCMMTACQKSETKQETAEETRVQEAKEVSSEASPILARMDRMHLLFSVSLGSRLITVVRIWPVAAVPVPRR